MLPWQPHTTGSQGVKRKKKLVPPSSDVVFIFASLPLTAAVLVPGDKRSRRNDCKRAYSFHIHVRSTDKFYNSQCLTTLVICTTYNTWDLMENRRNWHILIPDMCGINLHTSPLHNPYKYPIPYLHAMHGVWEGDTEIMNFSKTFNTMYLSGFWIWDDLGLTNLREWMSIV